MTSWDSVSSHLCSAHLIQVDAIKSGQVNVTTLNILSIDKNWFAFFSFRLNFHAWFANRYNEYKSGWIVVEVFFCVWSALICALCIRGLVKYIRIGHSIGTFSVFAIPLTALSLEFCAGLARFLLFVDPILTNKIWNYFAWNALVSSARLIFRLCASLTHWTIDHDNVSVSCGKHVLDRSLLAACAFTSENAHQRPSEIQVVSCFCIRTYLPFDRDGSHCFNAAFQRHGRNLLHLCFDDCSDLRDHLGFAFDLVHRHSDKNPHIDKENEHRYSSCSSIESLDCVHYHRRGCLDHRLRSRCYSLVFSLSNVSRNVRYHARVNTLAYPSVRWSSVSVSAFFRLQKFWRSKLLISQRMSRKQLTGRKRATNSLTRAKRVMSKAKNEVLFLQFRFRFTFQRVQNQLSACSISVDCCCFFFDSASLRINCLNSSFSSRVGLTSARCNASLSIRFATIAVVFGLEATGASVCPTGVFQFETSEHVHVRNGTLSRASNDASSSLRANTGPFSRSIASCAEPLAQSHTTAHAHNRTQPHTTSHNLTQPHTTSYNLIQRTTAHAGVTSLLWR